METSGNRGVGTALHRANVCTQLVAIAVLALSALLPTAALADGHGRGGGRGSDWHAWNRNRGGEFDGWRDGRSWYGGYGPRFGWWSINVGPWYAYPSPAYPYANPYGLPPTVMTVPYQPPAASPPGPPPTQYWYYCTAAKGYYPYVPSCPGGWEKVPATPPPG